VIRADEPAFPAFYRVVWTEHTAEFSDLDAEARVEIMEVVYEVERVLRAVLQPTKVNLASLGNVVAHLHWHVIARFSGDTHFPRPVWAEAVRAQEPHATFPLSLEELDMRMSEALRNAIR
jgi:diadenosine tetraphosphate (Ap4A) HIT family hydrolase